MNRSQALLLPETLDDYVGPDNPVRFIDAFVDGLDLEEAGFVRAKAKATGRPGYHPRDLLKLYIYGYLNRIRSMRKQLQDSSEDQLSLTDPDARAMAPTTRVGVGYNIQIAVDTKHNLIAEQQVHNQGERSGLAYYNGRSRNESARR